MKLNTFCPWKEHLYGLEEEMGIQGEILYCLYEVGHGLQGQPCWGFQGRSRLLDACRGA